jgi:hypothetical protein
MNGENLAKDYVIEYKVVSLSSGGQGRGEKRNKKWGESSLSY